MENEFSVVVCEMLNQEVGQLGTVHLIGCGLSLDAALNLAASSDGVVLAPGALPE